MQGLVWEKKEGSSQPCLHLAEGEQTASWQGLEGDTSSVEKVTWISEERHIELLPPWSSVSPAHLHVLTLYGCHPPPLKLSPCHPSSLPQPLLGFTLCPNSLNGTAHRGEGQGHQHHHLGAELTFCLWALGRKPTLKLTELWAPLSLMVHVGQLFIMLKLTVSLNESCLNCNYTNEWLIKLNESLREVVSEEVSQCITVWQIFFIWEVFVLNKEYWMVSYARLKPWEFTTNRGSKGGTGIFRTNKQTKQKKGQIYTVSNLNYCVWLCILNMDCSNMDLD